MKAFKAWAVIRDRSPQDAEFYSSQRLARFRKQDLSSLFQHVEYAFVEVRPLPKKKPAARVKGKHGKA